MAGLKSGTGWSESSGEEQIEEESLRRILLALAALALALSACEVRAEIAINEDGSGTMGMVFAVEPEIIQALTQSGFDADPFAELRADFADDPIPWTVEDFTEGRLTGIRATFAFASTGELLDTLEALDADEDADAPIKDFTIARRAGGWVFEGRATDPQEEVAGGSFPIPTDQLAELLKVQFRVTLPGRAAKHNANEVASGGGKSTFIWTPDVMSKSVALRAATTPGGAASPILPSLLALAALVIVSITWLRRVRVPAGQPGFSLPSDEIEAMADVRPEDQSSGGSKEGASLSS